MPLHHSIARLVEDFREAKTSAEGAGALGRAVFLEETFRKTLILSSASLFEHRISTSLLEHAQMCAATSDCVVALVTHKAIKRQYHTYFEWEKQALGAFPTLLGETRGGQLRADSKASPLKEAAAAFLLLGSLRNQLVHQNFAAFVCEKSSEEVIALCELAETFVVRVEELLRN